MIVASLATSAVGLSPIVGALIAGILIAETEYHGEVEAITAPFRGLGARHLPDHRRDERRPPLRLANWPRPAAGGGRRAAASRRWSPALLLRLMGARPAVAVETGVLMASPSETTLIVLAAATAAQLIAADTAAFWQIVTAIGLTVTPLLAKLGRLAARRVERRQTRSDLAALEQRRAGAVIIGFGRVGRLVAEMLTRHGKPYVAIDCDVDAVAAARAEGYHVLFGDVARPELLDRLGSARPAALILTMDNPVLVGRLTRELRACLPRPADHRPRARHRACGGALQGRRDRRGARDARSVAAAVRGGAGRPRRGDGPGDRLDPREARRAARRRSRRSGELEQKPRARAAAG